MTGECECMSGMHYTNMGCVCDDNYSLMGGVCVCNNPDLDGDCLPTICLGNERLDPKTNLCVPKNRKRLRDPCADDQYQSVHGDYCLHCPMGMHPTPSGNSCMPSDFQMIFDHHDSCPYGSIKQFNGDCKRFHCNERQRVLPDGECQYCPAFQRVARNNPYYCQPSKCNWRSRLTPSGSCKKCGPYKLSRGFYCAEPECYNNHYLKADGECGLCPPNHRKSPDQYACIAISCAPNQFITFEGFCV